MSVSSVQANHQHFQQRLWNLFSAWTGPIRRRPKPKTLLNLVRHIRGPCQPRFGTAVQEHNRSLMPKTEKSTSVVPLSKAEQLIAFYVNTVHAGKRMSFLIDYISVILNSFHLVPTWAWRLCSGGAFGWSLGGREPGGAWNPGSCSFLRGCSTRHFGPALWRVRREEQRHGKKTLEISII